jgi:hypothetical protein
MSKRTATLLLLAALMVATLFGRLGAAAVLGQDPTIPTRTPTPDPNAPTATSPAAQPTATKDDDNNPLPPPVASATATSPAGALPTATATTTGGIVPSATPTGTASATSPATGPGTGPAVGPSGCDDTPTIRAIGLTLVHTGPGEDYAAVAELQPDETRIIIGRAEFATWWQIQATESLIGWVADEEVDEFGNTGRVPLAPPPEINGLTPTPGLIWQPTALPFACTVTPTPTPTFTPTPTATPTATISPEETAAAATVEAVLLRPEGEDGGTGGSASLPGSSEGTDGKRLPDGAAASSPSNWLLPLAGIALVGAGILVALLARSRGVDGGGSSTE